MPTLKKYLSPKRNETGQTEILLRFCGGRGLIIRARSRIFINPAIWNDRTETIKSRFLDKETNETKNKLEKLESVILEAFLVSDPSSINKEWLDTTIDKFHFPEKYEEAKPPVTLLAIVDDFIKKAHERKDSKGHTISAKTIYQYKQLQTMLKGFANTQFRQSKKKGKQDWELYELDKGFYDKYVDFMYKEGYKLNTVGKHIKNLKVVLNSLPDELKSECKILNSRECKKLAEDIDNVYLNENELKIIEDFDFSGNPHLDRIRDWFLLLCWTGCRYSDLDKLSKEYIRNDLFQFRQQKTNNIVAIPLHPTVKKILKKYNGEIPAPISNQKFNAGLKEAMRIIGIDETIKIKHTIGGVLEEEDFKKYELISSHTGRRSFASNAYLAGIPSITIMKITGHKTESAFLKYIKITPEEHARKMAEAWENRYNNQTIIG